MSISIVFGLFAFRETSLYVKCVFCQGILDVGNIFDLPLIVIHCLIFLWPDVDFLIHDDDEEDRKDEKV